MSKQSDIMVKICGIATPQDYVHCYDAGASFVGMVFFDRSPRHLTLTCAREIAAEGRALTAKERPEAASGIPLRVALTVNMPDDELTAVIAAAQPDFIQLHGDESPERARAIRNRFGLPLIKAIRVGSADDLAQCKDWNDLADWLLFDAKGDPGALPGGTGHSFDWSLLANHAGETKWMLAGGLSPDNVARAIAVTGARGVDVSTGVESAPGKKDAERIQAFVSGAQLG